MDQLLNFPLNAVILSNALILSAAAIALVRFERRVRHDRKFWESLNGAALQDSVEPQSNEEAVLSGCLERRLAVMHQRLNELSMQLDEVSATPTPAQPQQKSHFMGHAVRMAKNGAGADDLVRVCGLSPAEARLVHKLHGQRSVPAQVTWSRP